MKRLRGLSPDLLRAMKAPQARLIATALQRECDEIDTMRPGPTRDRRLAELLEDLDGPWLEIAVDVRRKALTGG